MQGPAYGAFGKISLDSKPPSPDKDSRIAFRLDIQAKATQLKNMGKQANDVVKRMEKSPNKDCIQKALNDLTDFADGVQSLAALTSKWWSKPSKSRKTFARTASCFSQKTGYSCEVEPPGGESFLLLFVQQVPRLLAPLHL